MYLYAAYFIWVRPQEITYQALIRNIKRALYLTNLTLNFIDEAVELSEWLCIYLVKAFQVRRETTVHTQNPVFNQCS